MKTSTKPRRTTKTRARNQAELLELAGVGEEDRAAYDKLLREIEDAGRDEKRGWDRRWEAAGKVVAQKLFVLSDTPTAEHWLPKHTGEEYRTALRNIRVARFCTWHDELDYGPSKLDAAIALIEKIVGAPIERRLPIKLDALRVPVVVDGTPTEVSLADATTEQTWAAVRHDPEARRSRRSPVEAAYAKPLAAEQTLRDVTVRVRDGHVSFGAIPLAHVERFWRIGRSVDWRHAARGEDVEGSKRPPRAAAKKPARAKPSPKKNGLPAPKPTARTKAKAVKALAKPARTR